MYLFKVHRTEIASNVINDKEALYFKRLNEKHLIKTFRFASGLDE